MTTTRRSASISEDENNIDSSNNVYDNSVSESESESESGSGSENNIEDIYSLSIIRKSWNTSIPVLKPYIISCYNASGLYLFWIFLHYLSANMYTYYCVPTSFQGFIMSPFLVSAPHCRAIRWVVHNGGNTIDSMWTMLATWLCSLLITNIGNHHNEA